MDNCWYFKFWTFYWGRHLPTSSCPHSYWMPPCCYFSKYSECTHNFREYHPKFQAITELVTFRRIFHIRTWHSLSDRILIVSFKNFTGKHFWSEENSSYTVSFTLLYNLLKIDMYMFQSINKYIFMGSKMLVFSPCNNTGIWYLLLSKIIENKFPAAQTENFESFLSMYCISF